MQKWKRDERLQVTKESLEEIEEKQKKVAPAKLAYDYQEKMIHFYKGRISAFEELEEEPHSED